MLTSAALSTLAGRTVTEAQADAAITVVTAVAKSYTRGNGFTEDGPVKDLQAIIATATLRLLLNPNNLNSETMGALTVNYGSKFLEWTLTERAVLNRYRDRAL